MFKNNNPHALQQELNGLSKVMGRSDVATTFQGTGAYTDGNTINVPAMQLDARLTDREMAALRGYHIHEVAHVTDTDSDLWQSKKITKRKRSCWNAMEDVFIERKAQGQYSGARKNLQATVDTVLERENAIDQDMIAEGSDPYAEWWDQIDYAALQMARLVMGYESPALDEYIANMPDKLREEAQQFVDQVLACESTEETYKIAGKVNARMTKLGKEQAEEDQQQPGQGNGGDKGDGDGTSGDGEKQGDGDQQSSPSGSGPQGDEEGQQPSTSEGDASKTSGLARMDRAANVASDIAGNHKPSRSNGVDRRTARTYKSYEDYYEHLMAECDASRLVKDKTKQELAGWSRPNRYEKYTTLLENLAADTAARSNGARLARLLLAREDKRTVGGQLAGRVDRRRLAQLVAGQRNVFAHQETLRTDDTIVTVAVDASGSMNAFLTRLATAALNECLGRANCDYEILAWTGFSSRYDIEWNIPGLPNGEAPFNTNGLVEVKTSNQRSNDPEVRSNIANLLSQYGITPTLACLNAVAHRMLGHNQSRRILLMLTDGVPSGGYTEMDEVKVSLKAMAEMGIEVIGVAIDIDNDGAEYMFGKNLVSCTSLNLASTMLQQLEALLIGRAHEAA